MFWLNKYTAQYASVTVVTVKMYIHYVGTRNNS